MSKRKTRKFPMRVRVKNKYPLMVATTFFIYIFLFAFMMIFAAQAGPGIVARETEVEALPVLAQPKADENFATVKIENEKVNTGPLILVNGTHECKINGINLISLLQQYNQTYKVADYEVEVNSAILENINNMFGDFYKIKGENDIMVSNGYRSSELQQLLYNEEVETIGEQAAPGTTDLVAKPGYSEHQTGYALDLSMLDSEGIITEFTGEGEYSWIHENCAKYGFVFRYKAEKNRMTGYGEETWHFRYIGTPHAEYITQNGLCLEEYIDLLKRHTKDNPLKITDLNLGEWQIYYVAAQDGKTTDVPVPKDKTYEVSGNNVDGFIVSVKL